MEIIDQEKVKAKQRIAELEQEFQKEKENLNRHRAMLMEVKSAIEDIRGRFGNTSNKPGNAGS